MEWLIGCLTAWGLAAYVLYDLGRALWLAAQGRTTPQDWDDAAEGRLRHRLGMRQGQAPGRDPYNSTDGRRGVWCPWCETYHRG